MIAEVVADGRQRTIDEEVSSVEEAKEFRGRLRAALELCPELRDALAAVELWVWREASLGSGLSEAGMRTGVELRVSRRRSRTGAPSVDGEETSLTARKDVMNRVDVDDEDKCWERHARLPGDSEGAALRPEATP